MISALRTSFFFSPILSGQTITHNVNFMMNRKTQLTLCGIMLAVLMVYSLLHVAFPGFDLSSLGSLGFLFMLGYYALGIYGIYVLTQKGYLKGVSIILFLLVGWWFLVILVGLGAITLFIAALLPEKKRCRHCREIIHKEATRCPKCQGEITAKAIV